MIEVLNVYRDDCKGATSIMRGTRYGNPFVIGEDGTREEVVQKFRLYAEHRLIYDPHWLRQLKGIQKIKCCCVPQLCHGNVIVELVRKLYGI